MRIWLLILSLLFCASSLAEEITIVPFTSDGCSWFPDGDLTNQEKWLHCCRAHDIDYWQGGTEVQRLASDARLYACISDVGLSKLGVAMLFGVRLGGTPYLPTPFRWGFGWPYPRGYQALSNHERMQVKSLSPLGIK